MAMMSVEVVMMKKRPQRETGIIKLIRRDLNPQCSWLQ
jgi:hypothetical protein